MKKIIKVPEVADAPKPLWRRSGTLGGALAIVAMFALSIGACMVRPQLRQAPQPAPQPEPGVTEYEPEPAPEPPAAENFTRKIRVRATGYGVARQGMTGALARLNAQEAAKNDAKRNLWEKLGGFQIDSSTTVQNFVTTSDVIETRAYGFLKGVKLTRLEACDAGIYEAEVELDLNDFWEYIDSRKK